MRRACAAALVTLALASCSPVGGAGLPPSPPTVDVTMRDYRYDYDRGSIHPGRVVFRMTNAGPHFHQLALIPIPPDLPPLEVQVRGISRANVTEVASSPPLKAGAGDTFAANLTPGRWGFVCFFLGPEGSHAALGMASEFKVG